MLEPIRGSYYRKFQPQSYKENDSKAKNVITNYLETNGHTILDTEEELISGSTRLKAGTAQKICLNIISSMVMIKMGRVQDGIMSHMVATNTKLRERKIRMNRNL